MRSGNANKARDHAAHSWDLHHTAEAAALAFLACIALDDFALGRLWHQRAEEVVNVKSVVSGQ